MQISWSEVKSQLELSLAQLSPSLFFNHYESPCTYLKGTFWWILSSMSHSYREYHQRKVKGLWNFFHVKTIWHISHVQQKMTISEYDLKNRYKPKMGEDLKIKIVRTQKIEFRYCVWHEVLYSQLCSWICDFYFGILSWILWYYRCCRRWRDEAMRRWATKQDCWILLWCVTNCQFSSCT